MVSVPVCACGRVVQLPCQQCLDLPQRGSALPPDPTLCRGQRRGGPCLHPADPTRASYQSSIAQPQHPPSPVKQSMPLNGGVNRDTGKLLNGNARTGPQIARHQGLAKDPRSARLRIKELNKRRGCSIEEAPAHKPKIQDYENPSQ
jgi:hypothetical protein